MSETQTFPIPTPEAAPPEESNIIDKLTVAYHGLRASVARRQMERAGSGMEAADHKIALLTDLQAEGAGGPDNLIPAPTASGKRAHPRTNGEHGLAENYLKKTHKKIAADTYAYRARKDYSATVDIISNPGDDPGSMSQAQKRHAIRAVRKARKDPDNPISVFEANKRIAEIKAKPPLHGDHVLKRTQKGQRRATREHSLEGAIEKQQGKRDKAIRKIKKFHSRTQEHLELAGKEDSYTHREVRIASPAPEAEPATVGVETTGPSVRTHSVGTLFGPTRRDGSPTPRFYEDEGIAVSGGQKNHKHSRNWRTLGDIESEKQRDRRTGSARGEKGTRY